MKSAVSKYTSIGLSCLPCKRDKSPDVQGTWSRVFDISEFDRAEAIGIKCGKESGGLECIDIDNHNNTAKDNLIEFIDQIKELYEKYKFPIEISQRGGYHFLYRCETFEGNKKLAQVPVWDDSLKRFKPDTIFETRGEGGYFCAYPSPGYQVVKNDIFEIPTILPEERTAILNVCRSFNTWVEPTRNEFEQTDKPGDLYNQKTEAIDEMKRLLIGAGWSEKGKLNWCRPGKKEGISATLGKVAPNCFYVFSSSAYPFEPNKGYSPFQVKALLEYSGDFKQCAKDLSERYEMKPQRTPARVPEVKEKTIDEKRERLNKVFIDTEIEIEKPPVILYLDDQDGFTLTRKRVFTLGNFSAIIGKAKSRKTFNLTMMTASLLKNGGLFNKFYATLPDNKRQVLYFDTEQGLYDSRNVAKKMERMSGNNEFFAAFNIREYSPRDRCEIISDAFEIFQGVGFVALDGIADLATAINDEEEATRVTGLLLKWTKQYNCHICSVLHQNKNDNYATGHLGSSVMKKAEIVISVTKEIGDKNVSVVSCDYSRGIDFEDYRFTINDHGLPELTVKQAQMEVSNWYD